jgi:hypothetical protein
MRLLSADENGEKRQREAIDEFAKRTERCI